MSGMEWNGADRINRLLSIAHISCACPSSLSATSTKLQFKADISGSNLASDNSLLKIVKATSSHILAYMLVYIVYSKMKSVKPKAKICFEYGLPARVLTS